MTEQYSLYGGPELNARLSQLVDEIRNVFNTILAPSDFRAVVMLGGYGRGEGGVEWRDGIAHPHNNLDFLIIFNSVPTDRQNQLREQADAALQSLRESYDIGIDISSTTVSKLKRSPSLVMWYDMRFGHKTIVGDTDFLPNQDQFRLDRVPAWNVRDLLVNRGTLLVINDLAIASGIEHNDTRRMIIKHAVKAIIGYGDALLYFLGDYDWSYAEKQRRMQRRTDVSADFRKVYDEAMEFRFQPNYDNFRDHDLGQWMEELREYFAPIHLQCESLRLGKSNLNWDSYFDAALNAALWQDASRPRAWAKKARNILRSTTPGIGTSLFSRLGSQTAGMQGLLPTLFPLVAYRLSNFQWQGFAAQALGTEASFENLRNAYLQRWGEHGDTNFFNSTVARYQIALEPQEVAA